MIDTAFSFTRRQFRRWPVIEVYDLLDYSVADQYADQYPYVWLKNESETIRDDFDWSWQPPEDQRDLVHCFSKCLTESNRPISWNVLKLVSTNKNSRTAEKSQPLIACWETLSRTIAFYSTRQLNANLEKFYRCKKRFPDAIYYDDKNSIQEIVDDLSTRKIENTVFIFNIDIELNHDFVFDFVPVDNNTVYQFRVDHESSNFPYEDYNAICLNKQAIENYETIDCVVSSDRVVGTLVDYKDPYCAWVSAYRTGVLLHSDAVKPKIHKNKILTELISHDVTRIDQFLQDGVQTAMVDYESFGNRLLDDIDSFKYLLDRFKQRQDEKQNITVNKNANAARLRAQFGSESEEYQQALKSI